MISLVAFDLDGTLAASKAAVDAEMAGLLGALLGVARVAVISGGDWPQFETQLLSNLPAGGDLTRLSLLPTCGAKFYTYQNAWTRLYAETIGEADKQKIEHALRDAVAAAGVVIDKTYGEQIEDRGTQITFSALGQHAPGDVKKDWDPSFAKRKAVKAILDPMLPGFSVRLGGATSIDVTRPGIDKAYGIRKLRDTLGVPIDRMLFAGDALFPGGNDYAAKEAGVRTVRVRDPEETKRVIETLVACLGPGPASDEITPPAAEFSAPA